MSCSRSSVACRLLYRLVSWLVLCLVLNLVVGPACRADPSNSVRTRILFDRDWKFQLGDTPNAQAPEIDDKSWRDVTLPHDWSIEGDFDAKAPMGGAGGFLPAGTGWYRKHFQALSTATGGRVNLEFEGVYMNADVWCNGHHLVHHPNGYTSFNVDLSAALKLDDNVLAVRVDNSVQKNSRWYSGSGIYRHVWLTTCGPLHMAPWGVFASAPKADADRAEVSIETVVNNDSDVEQKVEVVTSLLSPLGNPVGNASSPCVVAPHSSQTISQQITVPHPAIWSPEKPQISTVVSLLEQGNSVVDRTQTSFGIRKLSWNSHDGLLLNGSPIKVIGGCIHGDNGVLGVAAFDRAEERKIEMLKAAGFNGIRTAHAPPSPALLDACDRLGMLVMEDAFDCWFDGKNNNDYHLIFKDWWDKDIDAMVRRDRNHPSLVFWNIGNEIPKVNSDLGVDYNEKLVNAVHALDTSRPVTNAILFWPNANEIANAQKNWSAEDIVGTNYALNQHIREHINHLEWVLVSTESSPGNPGDMWQSLTPNAFVVGDFVWSAQDYLGESGIGRWFYVGDPSEPLEPVKGPDDKEPHPLGHGNDRLFPWHGSLCGDIDLIGDRKPMSHWRNIVWDRGEKLYMGVEQSQDETRKIICVGWGFMPVWESWTWPGWEGKKMVVDVYSRYPSVRLFCNGQVIGDHETGEKQKFCTRFDVTYQPGKLKAVGLQNGTETGESCELSTVGAPAAIRLIPDRTGLRADREDLSFVQVEVMDKDGNLQVNADEEISFTVTGPAVIAGLGNANMKNLEPYQSAQCRVFHGKALIVLRSTNVEGPVELKAQAEGLTDAECPLITTAPSP